LNRARPVTLCAVSKTKPVSMLQQVYDCGHRSFGENYVQEICDKSPQLPSDIKWHFIGHLQTNKCKKLLTEVQNIYVVETVDSLKLALQLNKVCETLGRKELNIYVQVNTSGEVSKFGCEPSECVQLAQDIVNSCDRLQFKGLMTIGAYEADPTPLYFQRLQKCRDDILKALPNLDAEAFQLSMGMSHDFDLALEYGSTEVRVGSAIFGSRVYADTYRDKDKEDDNKGGEKRKEKETEEEKK
jgi:PLP dependent protein